MTVSFFGSECKVQMHCHRIACKNRGTKIMWTNFSRDAPAKDVSTEEKTLVAKKSTFFSAQVHKKANLDDVAKYRGVYYRRINFAGGHCSFSRMLSENSSSYAFQLPSKSTKCRSFSRYNIHWTCKTRHFCWVILSRGWGFLMSRTQCNRALSLLGVWRGWGGGVIFPTGLLWIKLLFPLQNVPPNALFFNKNARSSLREITTRFIGISMSRWHCGLQYWFYIYIIYLQNPIRTYSKKANSSAKYKNKNE